MTSARVKVFSEASRPPGPAARRRGHRGPPCLAARRRGPPARPSADSSRPGSRLGQLLPPARHEFLDALMAFAVPGGARRHGAGAVGGVRADGRFDLGRAVGVDFPGFFGDARDGPTAQAPRPPGVRLDAVAELDGLGGSRHAADGGGGVEVVSQQPRVERFPAASFVAHRTKFATSTWSWTWGSPALVVAWRDTAQVRPSVGVRSCARPRLPPWSVTTSSR